MSWVRPYIGVPFERENCWEICRRALLEQKGLALPDFRGCYARDRDPFEDRAEARARAELLQQQAATAPWTAVPRAAPFDMLLLRIAGVVLHCALVVDEQYALSSRPPIGGHLLAYRIGRNAQRIVGIYRHAALCPPAAPPRP